MVNTPPPRIRIIRVNVKAMNLLEEAGQMILACGDSEGNYGRLPLLQGKARPKRKIYS